MKRSTIRACFLQGANAAEVEAVFLKLSAAGAVWRETRPRLRGRPLEMWFCE
jgi:hypothetical protein